MPSSGKCAWPCGRDINFDSEKENFSSWPGFRRIKERNRFGSASWAEKKNGPSCPRDTPPPSWRLWNTENRKLQIANCQFEICILQFPFLPFSSWCLPNAWARAGRRERQRFHFTKQLEAV